METQKPGLGAGNRKGIPYLLKLSGAIFSYLVLFLILDWLAYNFQTLKGFSLWYPSLGLSLALLLVFGVCFLPFWIAAKWLSSVWIYQTPLSMTQTLALALISFGGYGLAAYLLKYVFKIDLRMRAPRDLHWLTIFAVAFSFLVAVFSIALLITTNFPDFEETYNIYAVLDWWVGDLIGILVITPLILVHGYTWLKNLASKVKPEKQDKEQPKPQKHTQRRRNLLVSLAQSLSILITIWIAFESPYSKNFHIFYFVLLPVVWISLYHGFWGATIGIFLTNLGMILAAGTSGAPKEIILEIQAITLVITFTGLILGMVVDERWKSERELQEYSERMQEMVEARTNELRQTQEQLVRQERLAVLGQLGGGIVHELRTPLGVIKTWLIF